MNLSFIKLDINIMDDSKMKFIVKLPDGDKLFRLWIGLLCLAMKSGRPGIVEIGNQIPFTTEMLANHFDIELNTVKLALDTFQTFKMIEFWDDGTMFICNFVQHQQLDKIEKSKEVSRLSSKRYREKIKLLGDGHVTVSDETDKDIDKEKDKELIAKFEKFWSAYPNKKSKKNSLKAFKKINPDLETFKKMIEALEKQRQAIQWQKDSGQFIPLPSTWLNGERWTDEVSASINGDNKIIELKRNY